MSKKLVLPDQGPSINSNDDNLNENISYKAFLDHFKAVIPIKDLENSIKKFEVERECLSQAIKHSLSILREYPFLSAFLIWTKHNPVKNGYPNYAKMLIEKEILQFKDEKGHLWVIKDLKQSLFIESFEMIRCRKELEIWQREMLVLSFLDFMNWMKETTHLSVFEIKDNDKEKASRRLLKHDDFIKFLNKLDGKYQLVAKLLYFGGSRTLAEVLNIEMNDIDFNQRTISFGSQHISYSKHIFEDIRSLIKGKKTPKIFSSQKQTLLNPATIFRNFKEAFLKLGLGDIYTPKILTTEV